MKIWKCMYVYVNLHIMLTQLLALCKGASRRSYHPNEMSPVPFGKHNSFLSSPCNFWPQIYFLSLCICFLSIFKNAITNMCSVFFHSAYRLKACPCQSMNQCFYGWIIFHCKVISYVHQSSNRWVFVMFAFFWHLQWISCEYLSASVTS